MDSKSVGLLGGYVRPPFLLQPAIVVALIGFRLVCAALVATYGNPDEHWQAPEVAHSAVFGTGFLTWEVHPDNKLRSGGHALLLTLAYRLALAVGITSPSAVSALPRVVHALLAAATDAAVLVLALRVFGSRPLEARAHTRAHARAVAVWALFAHVVSWFVAYMGGRPVVNSLESALFAIGLANWTSAYAAESSSSDVSVDVNDPDGARRSTRLRRLALAGVMAGLAVGVRPTAALPWCALGLHFLATQPLARSLREMIPAAGAGALLGLLAASGADWWMYGMPSLPLLSFLRFNLLAGLDAFYGAYPRAWYFYDGIPAVVAAFIPPVAIGIAALSRPARQAGPLFAAVVTVAGLSAAAHKEHRFLLPLTPIFALYAGRGLWEVLQHFQPPEAVHSAVVAIARAAFSDEPEERDAERDSEVDEAELPSLAAELVLEGQTAAGQEMAATLAPQAVAGTGSGPVSAIPDLDAAKNGANAGTGVRKRRQASAAASAVLAASSAAASTSGVSASQAVPAAGPAPSGAAAASSSSSSSSSALSGVVSREGGDPAENWHGARRTRSSVVPLHTPPPASSSPASATLHALRQSMPPRLAAACPVVGLCLLLLANAALLAYFGCVHQRGAVSVARALRDEAAEAAGTLLQVSPLQLARLYVAAAEQPSGSSSNSNSNSNSNSSLTSAHLLIQREEAAAVPRGIDALGAILAEHQGVAMPSAAAHKGNATAAQAAFASAFSRRVMMHGLRLPLAAFASAHYLMQCHSAPFHATVHSPLMRLVQLDCSPPLPPGGILGMGKNNSMTSSSSSGSSDGGGLHAHTTEAALWRRDPGALLRALYGPQPVAPLLCTLVRGFQPLVANNSAEGGHEANASQQVHQALNLSVPRVHDASAAATLYRQFLGIQQVLQRQQSLHGTMLEARIPEGLAVHPAFLATASDNENASMPQSGRASHRGLPTHIVMFDTDAARPVVRTFLQQHGYLAGMADSKLSVQTPLTAEEIGLAGGREFFFGVHGADAHSQAASEPSRVLLLLHPCWRAAQRG